VEAGQHDPVELVAEHQVLGVPLLFLVAGNEISVWQVHSSAPPRMIAKTSTAELPRLFAEYRRTWDPLAIHRAKSIGQTEAGYQLDFVDLGLLPAIEGEIHTKLDRLLSETLSETHAALRREGLGDVDDRVLFRSIFRLLAAKVQQDLGHEPSGQWDTDDVGSVIRSHLTLLWL
jgi:hypothetical protein